MFETLPPADSWVRRMYDEMSKTASNVLLNASTISSATWESQEPLTLEKMNESLKMLSDLPRAGGLPGRLCIYTDPMMKQQFRFPRTKAKRICRKWAKRPQNFRASREFLIDMRRGALYCHPQMFVELQRQIGKSI